MTGRSPSNVSCRRGAPSMLLAALLLTPGLGAATLPELHLETLATGLDSPVSVTNAGDARLFLTLQDGRIVIWDGTRILPEPFLDLRSLVSTGGERGLLSVAFHPLYPSVPLFFVDYTDTEGDTVVARYRVSDDPDRADPASAVVVLHVDQPFPVHNGGQLQFGPDGYLYVALGDGGRAFDPLCNAQRDDTLLGKLLRLDVDHGAGNPSFFTIPPDNPFIGVDGVRDEIWVKGLRNPWRFSFDRATGDLFLSDVGQGEREEIDLQPASSPGGENYGWKVMEGTRCTDNLEGCSQPVPACGSPELTLPILEYTHQAGNCAVVGGYVYHGQAIPDLDGAYLYGDFCTGTVWAARRQGPGPRTAWASERTPLTVPRLTSFGEGAGGEIYLVSQEGGLYRLEGAAAPPPEPEPGVLRFSQAAYTAAEETGKATIVVHRSGAGDGAVSVRYRTGSGSATPGVDYTPVAGTLSWEDGDTTPRSFEVPLQDDGAVEPLETVPLVLEAPDGGAALGSPATATLSIKDDDLPTGPCTPDDTVLCLEGGRFRVEATWEDFTGTSGSGRTVPLAADSGYLWFFSPDNVELVVKVLDACEAPFRRFWVFAAGLTNVGVTLTVADTHSRQVRRYTNAKGSPFQPIQDTDAFATCP